MSSDEERIAREVVERYLRMRWLDLPVDHGMVWDLSCDVSREYYRGPVDRRHIESQIMRPAVEALERRKANAEPGLRGAGTGERSLEDKINSMSDRKLVKAVMDLYDKAEKLIEIDVGSSSALLNLYKSELERRGYEVLVEPQVVLRLKKKR